MSPLSRTVANLATQFLFSRQVHVHADCLPPVPYSLGLRSWVQIVYPTIHEDARRDPTAREAPARSRYDRLFTDEELDDLENNLEGTVPTDTEVAPEPEEYDKKHEDRLYPLDEIELKRRVKKNAEAVKGPSIANMAKFLDVPVETLERTREASPAGSSSPEYWEKWYRDTLESSAEAKRANRDLKTSVASCVSTSLDATKLIYEDFGIPSEERVIANDGDSDGSAAKDVVCANIVLLHEDDGDGATDEDASEAPQVEGARIVSSDVKPVARKPVYRLLNEAKCEPSDVVESPSTPPDDVGPDEVAPLHDKALVLDWEWLRWNVYCVAEVLGIADYYWKPIMAWVGDYFEGTSARIWSRLWERLQETCPRGAEPRPRRRDQRSVCFDYTTLSKNRAEALEEAVVLSEREDAASNYVQGICPERPPPERDRKPSFVAVATIKLPDQFGVRIDDDEDGDCERSLSRFVEGDRQFVCSLRNFERLGRSAETLKSCDGQDAAATEDAECEYRWNGVSVDEGEKKVKVSGRNGLHVDAITMESSWIGQVGVQLCQVGREDVSEEGLCKVTIDHAETACCLEVTFGVLVEGALLKDGTVCEELERTFSAADEKERFGAATTDFQDRAAGVAEEVLGTVDGECFDTVVTVISCDAFPESCEDRTKCDTVSSLPLGKKTIICKDYSAVARRRSGLVYRGELVNRLIKDGYARVEAVPVVERWCWVPPERDKSARMW